MENLVTTSLHSLLMDRCARCGLPFCDCRACREGRVDPRTCDACELARAAYFTTADLAA